MSLAALLELDREGQWMWRKQSAGNDSLDKVKARDWQILQQTPLGVFFFPLMYLFTLFADCILPFYRSPTTKDPHHSPFSFSLRRGRPSWVSPYSSL